MKNYILSKLTLLFSALLIPAVISWGQCVIPINDGQSYTEDFESGTMNCWTVESTSSATWAVMSGTASNVVAFQNAAAGDEARLISPTFDMSGISGATFSFGYAMMGLYNADQFVVSYRTSPSDTWHNLGSYSFNDWVNVYEESFELPDLSSTYQVSFLGHSNGGYYIFIDNIEIASAGGCARPVSLQASEITAFSALLGWSTTENQEGWTIEINGTQKPVDVQPYLMEGLEPQTTYTFRVKANCAGGMESEWSYPMSFKTACDVITVTNENPYFDDFEASEDFVCWHNEIELGDDGWVVDPGYLFPNNTAFFIWLGQEAWLVSAPLDISTVTHPTLRFKHKQPHGELNADELSVWYCTSLSDYWHLLGEYVDILDDWEDVSLSLPEVSTTFYIAFKGKSNNADGVYVDDVWVGHDEGVGIIENPSLVAMVSPNPATDKATIVANFADGDVTVFDLFGRQVLSATLHEGRVELDLKDLVNGIYTARIAGDGGVVTIKVVKE